MTRGPWIALLLPILLVAADSAVEQAWKLAANHRRTEAIQLLQTTLDRNPDEADARLLLGSLLTQEKRYGDAVEQLTVVVRQRPQSGDAQNALGQAYMALGDFRAAERAFEVAVSDEPGDGSVQLNLGRALIATESFAAAAAPLDRALAILKAGSEAADAHYLRAKIYSDQNEAGQAARELEKAVALVPAFPEAWSDLGQARQNLGDRAAALAALQRAVRLAPDDAVAQYRLGAEYLGEQKAHLAIGPLERADRLNPSDQSILNALQKALRQDGQTAAADQVKQRLADVLAQRETAGENQLAAVKANNEGARLQKEGDLRAALEKYRSAVGLDPNNVPIRVNFAIALLRLGQWSEGLNELHRCAESDPANEKIRAALKDALAQAPPQTVPDWAKRKN